MEKNVTRNQVCSWLKKEDTKGFSMISDQELSIFLNGLIVQFRGKKDGELPQIEKNLNLIKL